MLTSRRGRLAAIVGVLLLALIAGLWELSRAKCTQLVGDIICRVETSQKLVALTFDDGPTARGLDAVLPVLAAHDATATFFLIGEEARKRPDLTRQLIEAGHEVGNHSFSHRRMIGRSQGFYRQELVDTELAIASAGGWDNPLLFRPPHGKKLYGLPAVLDDAGYRTVMWDVEDPKGVADPRAFAGEVLGQVRPGSIILLHPMYGPNETARAALPLILEGLAQRGYRAVTVSELLEAKGG